MTLSRFTYRRDVEAHAKISWAHVVLILCIMSPSLAQLPDATLV